MPPVSESAASLVAAERGFSAQSVATDMRSAFLANFADDGVMVRDGWVNAHAVLTASKAPPITLQWAPAFVEVARSGELGLSTGPWTRTSRVDPTLAAAHGRFVSIWRRQAGGPWRVEVDLGIVHAMTSPSIEDVVIAAPSDGRPMADGTLADAETRFVHASMQSGLRAAYARSGDSALRFCREGLMPITGKDAALASAAMGDERLIWFADRMESARSGDFGYVRGTYAATSAPSITLGYFVRVWHATPEGWRIALDVTNAMRPR